MTTKELFEVIIKTTGLSQSALANKLGIAPMRITEWLNGSEIRFSRANDICAKLDLKLDFILAKHAQDKALSNSSNQPLNKG